MADPVCLVLHLTTENSSLILVQNFPDVFDALHGLRPIISKYRDIDLGRWRFVVGFGVRRVVAQKVILDQYGARVDPEAINTAVESESHGTRYGFTYFDNSPVQIRLAR